MATSHGSGRPSASASAWTVTEKVRVSDPEGLGSAAFLTMIRQVVAASAVLTGPWAKKVFVLSLTFVRRTGFLFRL